MAEVFDALAPSVYASAVRVLGDNSAAQDVVQDVFVELWAHPGRYDPAAGTLRTYLTMLARHRAVDVIRSELRRRIMIAAVPAQCSSAVLTRARATIAITSGMCHTLRRPGPDQRPP